MIDRGKSHVFTSAPWTSPVTIRRSFPMIDADFWFTGEQQIGVDLGNRHSRVAQGLDLEAADQGGWCDWG
jgi:hypothetical protein